MDSKVNVSVCLGAAWKVSSCAVLFIKQQELFTFSSACGQEYSTFLPPIIPYKDIDFLKFLI